MSVVENLKINRGNFNLAIESWEIPDTGITALIGESGSGKTSIIRGLLGLDTLAGLSWDFKGVDLAKVPLSKRRLGVVFQNYELFPHLTAKENILFAAKSREIPKDKANQKLSEYVEKLNLSACIDRKAKLLSTGEKQRVALARALIGEPIFLFLDEPFSALDLKVKSQARKLVKDVLDAEKIPALLVTHDEVDLKELADQVFRIEAGTIVIA